VSTVEKLSKEFEALTPEQKAEFLNKINVSPEGEYIAIEGRIYFFPYDDEPLSEEEEKALQEGYEDVKAGRVKSLEQVEKELEI